MASPYPKPTKLKILEGNPGKRALNHDEPQPRPESPDCPAWLDRMAKALWRELSPELESLGLLTCVDGLALATYCEAYSHWRKVRVRGLAADATDAEMERARKARDHVNKIGALFGLDPSSRTRIKATPKPKADPMEQFLEA